MKRETLQGAHAWATERDVRLTVFRWIARCNNHTRRHSRCDYQPPVTFEARYTPTGAATTTDPTTLPTAA